MQQPRQHPDGQRRLYDDDRPFLPKRCFLLRRVLGGISLFAMFVYQNFYRQTPAMMVMTKNNKEKLLSSKDDDDEKKSVVSSDYHSSNNYTRMESSQGEFNRMFDSTNHSNNMNATLSSAASSKRIRINNNKNNSSIGAIADEPFDAQDHSIPSTNITSDIITIGYVVSVTACPKDGPAMDLLAQGGAVLKHSVHRTSIRAGTMGGGSNKYDYKFYAIYHPDAAECAIDQLADLGYEMIQRDTPVNVSDIRGHDLRQTIWRGGCCGEKELIKLEAYTLTSHPIVVHMDLDTVLFKPLDAIFDMMLKTTTESLESNSQQQRQLQQSPSNATSFFNISTMWPTTLVPSNINFLFTRDYNMIAPTSKYKKYPPVQGGFYIVRPDMKVYRQIIEVILEGNFTVATGWGGVGGIFYGYATIQGIFPYFYDVLHPGQSLELNRCVYNHMNDNPYYQVEPVKGQCRTGQAECEDCRLRPMEDVVSAHFTLCGKPWRCAERNDPRLCIHFDHQWFRIRSELEQFRGKSARGPSAWKRDYFFGFCWNGTVDGYQRIEKPRSLLPL